jgi:hypothetical protein
MMAQNDVTDFPGAHNHEKLQAEEFNFYSGNDLTYNAGAQSGQVS